jgi:hypothetical protein
VARPARVPLAPRPTPHSTPRPTPRPSAPRAGLGLRWPRLLHPRRSLPPIPWRPLLLWPLALSALVTLLRLAGELLRWPEAHFSRLPGGGLATVGITWLVPLVGLWIGWKLHRAGHRPASPARALCQPLAALAAGWALAALAGRLLQTGWTAHLALWGAVSLAVAVVSAAAWPAAGAVLLAYAAAARGLVVLVMAAAFARGWGTHYDALPPGFPAGTTRLARFLLLGLLPQATIWVGFTVAVGLAFAALGRAAAVSRRAL